MFARTNLCAVTLVTAAVTLTYAAPSYAATYTVNSLSNGINDQPSTSLGVIGFDKDKPAPIVTGNGFYAKGDDNGGSNGDYTSVRFTAAAIGMSGLTLGQITAVSYDAMNAIDGAKDWRFKVYTAPQTGQPASAWFGVRVEAPTTTSGTTYETHNLVSYDRITVGGTGGANVYANADGTLPTDFTNLLTSSANQLVMFFDISAGAKSGGHDYETFLNNITIAASGFETATITAVPEPTSIGLAAVAGLGLLARRRRA
jgi:hypothetical protein